MPSKIKRPSKVFKAKTVPEPTQPAKETPTKHKRVERKFVEPAEE